MIIEGDHSKLDIDSLSDSGGTALMYAAGGGHAETCRILIEKGGANVDARVKATPEYLARVAAQKEKEKAELEKSSSEGEGSSPPPTPSNSNMIEVSDVEHSDGGTALTVAAEGGFVEVARLLVEAGADVRVTADDNRTALSYSIIGGHLDISLLLLANGADPNSVYEDEKVGVMCAYHNGVIVVLYILYVLLYNCYLRFLLLNRDFCTTFCTMRSWPEMRASHCLLSTAAPA
jgi:ankyrin repeat protein